MPPPFHSFVFKYSQKQWTPSLLLNVVGRNGGEIFHFIFSSEKLLFVVVTDTHNDKEVKTRLNECNNLK